MIIFVLIMEIKYHLIFYYVAIKNKMHKKKYKMNLKIKLSLTNQHRNRIIYLYHLQSPMCCSWGRNAEKVESSKQDDLRRSKFLPLYRLQLQDSL